MRWIGAVVILTGLLVSGVAPNSRAIGQTQPNQANALPPVPARNDVARSLGPADEVLMLRHQFLQKGAHEVYYRASLFGVWPWYERLGARMTGQWQVAKVPTSTKDIGWRAMPASSTGGIRAGDSRALWPVTDQIATGATRRDCCGVRSARAQRAATSCKA